MLNADYLVVDRFLKTELDAKALALALRCGMIDQLLVQSCSFNQLPIRSSAGLQMLLDLLAANGIIQMDGEQINLAQLFRSTLAAYRELLEAKIAFTEEVSKDVSLYFNLLIDNLPQFMESSATFRLFRYDRCFEATPSNLELARRWIRYTTALTHHEGRVLAGSLDLKQTRALLDVGGNSGELALRLCDMFPNLNVTVFDLPVVCEIGREHVRERAKDERITFQAGDVRTEDLPGEKDAVTLKSVLHDWPEPEAEILIKKAAKALRPGGLLVIFERAPLRVGHGLSYADLANLIFFHFFRPSKLYLNVLAELSFEEIHHETIRLEMDFHLITARRA